MSRAFILPKSFLSNSSITVCGVLFVEKLDILKAFSALMRIVLLERKVSYQYMNLQYYYGNRVEFGIRFGTQQNKLGIQPKY